MSDILTGKSSVLGQGVDLRAARDMLNDPNQIAEALGQAAMNTLAGSVFDDVLAPSGSGLYTEITANDLKVEGIGGRTEHNEYAMVRISPGDLKEVRTGDIGGKFRVSDEAIEAGDVTLIDDGISLLGAAMQDVLDDMMISALDKATENGNVLGATAGWRGVNLDGATPTPETLRPWADIVRAKRILRDHGLHANPSHLIVDEDTIDELSILYGPNKISETWGLEILTSPKVPAGTGYLLDRRNFGGLVTKKGLVVESWRDPAIRATWVQSFVEPTVFVSRPINVVKITGLDGTVNG